MTTTAAHSFPELVVDVLHRPAVSAPAAPASGTRADTAARLRLIQRRRAIDAAEEAETILGLAALCPDTDDPPPDSPGAKKTYWRTARELPGVSEFFLDELAAVLGVGRGTAAHTASRAFTWRHGLPATFTALQQATIDERRAQIFADTLEHTAPALAARVEAIVLPDATTLGFAALQRRILAVLLELDPTLADENRARAAANADVFLQPDTDGTATLGAQLPTDEAVEGFDFIDTLARQAKTDGDPRPIGQLRTEIFSLLVRGAAIAAPGPRTALTITAALEALEGTSTQPGEVNGHAITPAHLADLLRRVGALGLQAPDQAPGGSLTLALTDADGRLLATLSLADLHAAVRRGQGTQPPPDTDRYRPTAAQREFITTRDRTCRWPHCAQRTGWADHDHAVPHAAGGTTSCTNLCCLCRSHHRLKTFANGWTFRMEPDGTLHVTTPSGITRTTHPWAMRQRPPTPTAPAPADPDPPPF